MCVNTYVMGVRKELRCKTQMCSIACKYERLRNTSVCMGCNWLWLIKL